MNRNYSDLCVFWPCHVKFIRALFVLLHLYIQCLFFFRYCFSSNFFLLLSLSLSLSFFCGLQAPLKLNLLPADSRIDSGEFNEKIVKGEPHVLVDVRPAHHFKIVSLPNALNIPLSSLEGQLPEISSALKEERERRGIESESGVSLYVVCRRGNDSQRAVQLLHKKGFSSARDIIGGLEAWANDVDPNFPTY